MREKLKNIPYWVYDSLSILSAFITILTAVIAILKAVVTINKLENGSYQIICNPGLICLCVVLISCVIVCMVKVKKYGSILRNIREGFAFNYYNFLHDFRNTYFDMLRKHKNNVGQDDNTRLEILTKDTQNFLEEALDYLCDIMEKNTGQKISACVKLIENTGSVTDIDKESATVITFCRSRSSDKNRKANDENRNKSIYIKDNTDFYDILDKNSETTNSYFYQTDLLQYDKDLRKIGKKYKNTTENFEKYYRGTIVAPIRISKRRLHYLQDKQGYDIIGFLCIDSPSVNAFRNTAVDRENYSNIVKSFAAEIYIILNKYNFYLKKIIGGNQDGENV